MKRLALAALAALLALPAAAHAQWQLGGNVGFRSRPENGTTVNGTQLEMMIVHKRGATTHFFDLAWTQMRNETPDGGAVRENALEGTILFRRALRGPFGIGAGPALGYSLGCSSGGTGSVGYGPTTCLVEYATKGTLRPGYAIQLDLEQANARGAVLRAGIRASGHTVASGTVTPKPSIWLGFTLPLI